MTSDTRYASCLRHRDLVAHRVPGSCRGPAARSLARGELRRGHAHRERDRGSAVGAARPAGAGALFVSRDRGARAPPPRLGRGQPRARDGVRRLHLAGRHHRRAAVVPVLDLVLRPTPTDRALEATVRAVYNMRDDQVFTGVGYTTDSETLNPPSRYAIDSFD